jgi:hypothetical protein
MAQPSSGPEVVKGARVWAQASPTDDWKLATVTDVGDKHTVKFDDGAEATVPAKQVEPASVEASTEMHDMTHSKFLNEPSVLNCLNERFMDDSIYTMAGPVLIAMNPCKKMSIYTKEWADKYVGEQQAAGSRQGWTGLGRPDGQQRHTHRARAGIRQKHACACREAACCHVSWASSRAHAVPCSPPPHHQSTNHTETPLPPTTLHPHRSPAPLVHAPQPTA